jgi:hypothetical protein
VEIVEFKPAMSSLNFTLSNGSSPAKAEHFPLTSAQQFRVEAAKTDPALRAKNNQGKPKPQAIKALDSKNGQQAAAAAAGNPRMLPSKLALSGPVLRAGCAEKARGQEPSKQKPDDQSSAAYFMN